MLIFSLIIGLSIGPNISFTEAQSEIKQIDDKPYRGEIEADGYTYTYEAIPTPIQESRVEMFYQGKITIRGPDKRVVYQEITPFQPGMCSGFPKISKLSVKNLPVYKLLGGEPGKERWLVIICGSYTGRHQTMKVFFKDPISLKSTSLHFEDTTPNLSDIDGDGLYEAQVSRRVLFDDIGYGVLPYLTVYKLNIDNNLFGFIPYFGNKIIKHYFDYYIWLKSSLTADNFDDRVGPMLAALLATQNKSKICGEIKTFRSYGLTIRELQAWGERLTGLGYPRFNFTTCKEGMK